MERKKFVNPHLYEAVGLINFHAPFDHLPAEYCVDPYRSTFMLDQLGSTAVYLNSYAQHRTGYSMSPFLPEMKPAARGDFFHRFMRLPIFDRTWKVYQLGLSRDYPISNYQTRAHHQVMTAICMAGSLQTLYDRQPDDLISKLRIDFQDAEILDDNTTDKEVLTKAVRLMVITGGLHDSGTLAGGDTIKYLLKSFGETEDEELLLGKMLFPEGYEFQEPVFQHYRTTLREFMSQFGLGEKDLKYVSDCITGRSASLLGEMINPPSGDKLDFDRIAYTLQDWIAFGVLGVDLPRSQLPPIAIFDTQARLIRSLDSVENSLTNWDIAADYGKRGDFPWNTLDPSEDVELSPRGEIIFQVPSRVLALAMLRVSAIVNHYAGFKLLGQEKELQDALYSWVNRHEVPLCLRLPYLLSHGNQELLRDLVNLPELKDIRTIITGLETLEHRPLFGGYHLWNEKEAARYWAHFKVKIKPGLDTLVRDEKGGVATLGKRYLIDPAIRHSTKVILVDNLDTENDIMRNNMALRLQCLLADYDDSYVCINRIPEEEKKEFYYRVAR